MKRNNRVIGTIAVIKTPKSSFDDSDKYGHKKMLREVINMYCCPDCKPQSYLVWKDETHTVAICERCGFEQPFPKEKTK